MKSSIFGIELSPLLVYAILGFVWYKFGFKKFAIAFVVYFVASKPIEDNSTVINPNIPVNPNNPQLPNQNPVIANPIGIGYTGKVVDGTGPTGTTFIDFLANIPYPTTNGEYFPDRFPDIVPPTFADPVTGYQISTMIFAMNASVLAFKRRNINPWSKGVTVDLTIDRYENGVEVIGKNNVFPVPVQDFDSPIEFQNRGIATGWGLGAGESFEGKTNDEIYDIGVSVAGASYFGIKNGTGRAMLLEMDIENGYAEGQTQSKIDGIYNLFEGCGSRFQGYISSPYSGVFDTLGYLHAVVYPDKTGVFVNAPKNGVFWGTCQNGKAAGKSATNGTATKKIIWGSEVSHSNEEALYNDEEPMLAPNGITVLRVVNHFGPGATHEHYLARELGVNETGAFACEQYGYRWGGYTKSVCDRSSRKGNGFEYDDTNKFAQYIANGTAFGSLHIPRLKIFKIVITKAMVGTFLQTKWDRNSFPDFALTNCDAYHGWLAAIEELNFIKDFGDDKVSFTELFPGLKFLRWNTSLGFNDGLNTRIKAHDVQASKDVCTARGAVDTTRGYYVSWAAKAYGTENVNTVHFDYEDDNWILEPVTVTFSPSKDYDLDIHKMTRKV